MTTVKLEPSWCVCDAGEFIENTLECVAKLMCFHILEALSDYDTFVTHFSV